MKTLKTYPFSMLVILSLLFACQNTPDPAEKGDDPATEVQAVSLLGEPLRPTPLSAERREKLEEQLDYARQVFEKNPDDVDALIWLGRRTSYLGLKKEAIAIYTQGLEKHPASAKLYRHRGHQYIGLRKFNEAITDLERAAELIADTKDEIEPDGMPNARNIPTSTLHSNIWYHLGLAYYLCGDFDRALPAYRECMKVSGNPDMQVATAHWLYMTLRRLGKAEEAIGVLEPIHADMDIMENTSYYELLLMYKGERDPGTLLAEEGDAMDNASLGYGVGNWHLYNGQEQPAADLFQTIVKSGHWAAFGYIAAEADLKRMGDVPPGITALKPLHFRLEAGLEQVTTFMGRFESSGKEKQQYDCAFLKPYGDESPEQEYALQDRSYADSLDFFSNSLTFMHEDAKWNMELSGSLSDPFNQGIYMFWRLSKGDQYLFFINGEVQVYPSAQEAAQGKAIRLGPPYHFEMSTTTQGPDAMFNVGLKDANGSTLRVAGRKADDSDDPIHCVFSSQGEERFTVDAEYG